MVASPYLRAYMPPSRWLGAVAAGCLILLWLIGMVWANADLIAGRFALFMDEGVIFDGVKNILHPGGISSFVYAITDAGDQRYGRILWNLTAITAFLPERLWGEPGLIVAERITQALLLTLAFLTLTFTFVRGWTLRLLLLLLLLTLPFVAYYASMPKPEPLEILLLALFLRLHSRCDFRFGPHWIFLGLAFGAKISVLPFVVVVGLDSLWRSFRSEGWPSLFDAVAWFLLGLTIAVPILVLPIAPSLLVYYLCRIAWPEVPIWSKAVIVAITFVAGVFAGHRDVGHWVAWTFLNTTHGADESSINAYSWMSYFLRDWLVGPIVLNVAAVSSVGVLAILALSRLWHRQDRPYHGPLLLIVGGVAMIAAIFISAHRLWGFYLVPGIVTLLVGIVALAEKTLKKVELGLGQGQRWFLVQSIFAVATLIAWGGLAVFWWGPAQGEVIRNLAHRTDDRSYQAEYQTYKFVISSAQAIAKSRGRPISIVLDPHLFMPSDTPLYKVSPLWGFYTTWSRPVDLLVFGPTHTPGGKPTPKDSPEYPAFLAERREYAQHVLDVPGRCLVAPCYQRIGRLPDGGEILARQPDPKGA